MLDGVRIAWRGAKCTICPLSPDSTFDVPVPGVPVVLSQKDEMFIILFTHLMVADNWQTRRHR